MIGLGRLRHELDGNRLAAAREPHDVRSPRARRRRPRPSPSPHPLRTARSRSGRRSPPVVCRRRRVPAWRAAASQNCGGRWQRAVGDRGRPDGPERRASTEVSRRARSRTTSRRRARSRRAREAQTRPTATQGHAHAGRRRPPRASAAEPPRADAGPAQTTSSAGQPEHVNSPGDGTNSPASIRAIAAGQLGLERRAPRRARTSSRRPRPAARGTRRRPRPRRRPARKHASA